MLRVALKEAHEQGGDRLRAVADALVTKAMSGDVAAIREIGDRLDGKAAQQLIHTGDEEGGPVNQAVEIAIVDGKG